MAAALREVISTIERIRVQLMCEGASCGDSHKGTVSGQCTQRASDGDRNGECEYEITHSKDNVCVSNKDFLGYINYRLCCCSAIRMSSMNLSMPTRVGFSRSSSCMSVSCVVAKQEEFGHWMLQLRSFAGMSVSCVVAKQEGFGHWMLQMRSLVGSTVETVEDVKPSLDLCIYLKC